MHINDDFSYDPNAPKIGEDGSYAIAYPGFKSELNAENYARVNVGGIIVLDEGTIPRFCNLRNLSTIAGLRQKEIVQRYPYTVQTSMFATAEEVMSRDREGYIYLKEREVSAEIVELVKSESERVMWDLLPLEDVARGSLIYLENGDIIPQLKNWYSNMNEGLTAFTERALVLGVPIDEISAYIKELRGIYKEKLESMQANLRAVLQEYEIVLKDDASGKVDFETGLTNMGLAEDKSGYRSYVSKKYPYLPSIVINSESEAQRAIDYAYEIANADFGALFFSSPRRK